MLSDVVIVVDCVGVNVVVDDDVIVVIYVDYVVSVVVVDDDVVVVEFRWLLFMLMLL